MLKVISITAIMLAALYPLYFVGRKGKNAPPLSLSIAIVMAAALELFDLLALLKPEHLYFWKRFSLLVEAFIPPVWLWFSLTYARQNKQGSIQLFQRLLLAVSPVFAGCVLLFPISSFFYSPDFASEKILFLGNTGFIFYLLILIYLIIALINLEVTLTHTTMTSRWMIKFKLLGAGSILAMMILYYSQGLLYRIINMQMVPARSLVLIVAVAMMSYSRLKRGTDVTLCISRQMAYKSVVLMVVGIYLISLGLIGEGMKYFGDGFQRSMIYALGFLTSLGLLIILLSETIKRKIRVFIHKNFYRNKYDYRIQWLLFTDRLCSSQTSDGLLRSIVLGFCDIFGMGNGALFILNQERNTYHQEAGIETAPTTASFSIKDPIIEFMIIKKWVIDLRSEIPDTHDNPHAAFFRAQSACFIIPLFMNDGLDGFIILGKPVNANETYNFEDFDLMKILAKQAASALLRLRLSNQLACSREMAAIGKVSTFVMHDLKNLVSSLALILDNAKEHIAVPAFQDDLLISLGNTVTKMYSLISRLKHLPDKDSLQCTPVDLLQMAHDTAALVTGKELRVTGTHVIAEVDHEQFQKVALNLMLNAIEASKGKKPVTVEVGKNVAPFFRVTDEGCGMPEDFLRHAIFTPFTSTKEKGLGIGLYQSKQIIEAHGGKIEVVSKINSGTEFTVWLPNTCSGIPREEGFNGKAPCSRG